MIHMQRIRQHFFTGRNVGTIRIRRPGKGGHGLTNRTDPVSGLKQTGGHAGHRLGFIPLRLLQRLGNLGIFYQKNRNEAEGDGQNDSGRRNRQPGLSALRPLDEIIKITADNGGSQPKIFPPQARTHLSGAAGGQIGRQGLNGPAGFVRQQLGREGLLRIPGNQDAKHAVPAMKADKCVHFPHAPEGFPEPGRADHNQELRFLQGGQDGIGEADGKRQLILIPENPSEMLLPVPTQTGRNRIFFQQTVDRNRYGAIRLQMTIADKRPVFHPFSSFTDAFSVFLILP